MNKLMLLLLVLGGSAEATDTKIPQPAITDPQYIWPDTINDIKNYNPPAPRYQPYTLCKTSVDLFNSKRCPRAKPKARKPTKH